jgi:hypothetical protein
MVDLRGFFVLPSDGTLIRFHQSEAEQGEHRANDRHARRRFMKQR